MWAELNLNKPKVGYCLFQSNAYLIIYLLPDWNRINENVLNMGIISVCVNLQIIWIYMIKNKITWAYSQSLIV